MTDKTGFVDKIGMDRGAWIYIINGTQIAPLTPLALSSAIKQDIVVGDEVVYSERNNFTAYMKKTGNKRDSKPIEVPDGKQTPPKEPEKPQEPVKPLTDWEKKFLYEQRKQEIIHWQAVLNTATEIVSRSVPAFSQSVCDYRDDVEKIAVDLHEFIMDRVSQTREVPEK
jgi:hypothetical protein